MNAIEIEQAVSSLFEQPFDAAEFPYQLLEAYGNKSTTIKRLRTGNLNRSDVENGVLQHNNIHVAIAPKGKVREKLDELRKSPATEKQRVKFILATDGDWLEAEALKNAETVIACDYSDFPNHFGYFLPLAGISTVKQITENSFDIRATSRLNKLYIELLKINPDWGTPERRQEMNHFMARLIFCFFAEDTGIFTKLNYMGNHDAANSEAMFTDTVDKISKRDGSNTHQVIEQIFKAMDIKIADRDKAKIPRWARDFPYVNGQLFSGKTEVPTFNKIARSYLIHIGSLDWTQVNPDIFGSMIQAVTDDEERGALGMHYTSVPNILKVLNPLFLDDLREQWEQANGSPQKLLNLRKRMARIRVFDPACGSGNFLVIAYKEMREIEAKINKARNEPNRRTDIRLTNFRGIEIRHFSAEIARLALIIAEYQCDVVYRGQQEALADLLPLSKENWIKRGNALRIDWLDVCPPISAGEEKYQKNLFSALIQDRTDQKDNDVETYICGNPPYIGFNRQTSEQKDDIKFVFDKKAKTFGNLDYVCGWFLKAAIFNRATGAKTALVSTNSICQGSQVPVLWPVLYGEEQEIFFARTSFKWSNLAANNAGVTVIVVGIQNKTGKSSLLFTEEKGHSSKRVVRTIGPYLIPNSSAIIKPSRLPQSDLPEMILGNHPYYASELIFDKNEYASIEKVAPEAKKYIRPYLGSSEIIRGAVRYCLWIGDKESKEAENIPLIAEKMDKVRKIRSEKVNDKTAQNLVAFPYRFRDQASAKRWLIAIPQVSSENREYLPAELLKADAIISFQAYAIFDAPLWALSIITSKIHWNWIARICRRMRTDFSYSNTLGWNTFPLPKLTEKNKADLTQCAEDILLARSTHFPATIADLYSPEQMPENLRHAHERNDEVLERIYIGRRFKNDTERLEKLFDMYSKMNSTQPKVREDV